MPICCQNFEDTSINKRVLQDLEISSASSHDEVGCASTTVQNMDISSDTMSTQGAHMREKEPIQYLSIDEFPHGTPSPNRIFKYMTKKRLTVRAGKNLGSRVIGDLLMFCSREGKGCEIWVNQAKGRRLRIVAIRGLFLMEGTEDVIELNPKPSEDGYFKPIGWVTDRCIETKERLMERL